ncbi:MAG: hypothetical protein FJ118_16450 [Deltaproteobacteria bacterium]|nr:hypothetical protein [Deltaproteobacteria bacterium]
MKKVLVALLALVISLPLLSSCSALRSISAAKPGFDTEARAANPTPPALQDQANESWAVRYIPGLRYLSSTLPPPTQARTDWDKRMDKRTNPWGESAP